MTESADTSRVGLVVNPSASGGAAGRTAAALAGALRAHGFHVTDLSAETAGAALVRAQAAIAARAVDLLVVAGGDGMAHLGVNACAGTEVPLGIIALGTGNDIAAGLGLPVRNPAAGVATVAARHTRRIDAGRVEQGGNRPWFGGTLYAGFDAVVNARANRWSWPRGQARYNLAVLRELPVFSAIPYVVTVDGARLQTEAMLVIVANAPSYGGGMKVTPAALMDDGLFDVLVLERIGRAEFLRVFPQVFEGHHVEHPAVRLLRGRQVHLQAHGITAYADGEPFHPVPLQADVVPKALRVIVPEEGAS